MKFFKKRNWENFDQSHQKMWAENFIDPLLLDPNEEDEDEENEEETEENKTEEPLKKEFFPSQGGNTSTANIKTPVLSENKEIFSLENIFQGSVLDFTIYKLQFLEDHAEEVLKTPEYRNRLQIILDYFIIVGEASKNNEAPARILFRWQSSCPKLKQGIAPSINEKINECLEREKKTMLVSLTHETNLSSEEIIRLTEVYRWAEKNAVQKKFKLDSAYRKIKTKILESVMPLIERYRLQKESSINKKINEILESENFPKQLTAQELAAILQVRSIFPNEADWTLEETKTSINELSHALAQALEKNAPEENYELAELIEEHPDTTTFFPQHIRQSHRNQLFQFTQSSQCWLPIHYEAVQDIIEDESVSSMETEKALQIKEHFIKGLFQRSQNKSLQPSDVQVLIAAEKMGEDFLFNFPPNISRTEIKNFRNQWEYRVLPALKSEISEKINNEIISASKNEKEKTEQIKSLLNEIFHEDRVFSMYKDPNQIPEPFSRPGTGLREWINGCVLVDREIIIAIIANAFNQDKIKAENLFDEWRGKKRFALNQNIAATEKENKEYFSKAVNVSKTIESEKKDFDIWTEKIKDAKEKEKFTPTFDVRKDWLLKGRLIDS